MSSEGPALRPFLADLHVHTVLSPCAEVEMIPPLIVRRALALGLGIIAITDHNSAENVAAVVEAARETGLVVFPGIELQTREEVHLLCLFDTVEQAMGWQDVVYAHLPPYQNREDVFGPQFVVDAGGDWVRSNERLLLTSTSLTVEEAATGVEERHGLCIAAHVDRPSFSLLANLGFVPPGIRLAALEATRFANVAELQKRHPSFAAYPFVCSGDAHRLDEMTDRSIFTIAERTIAEIALALRKQDGRRVKILNG